MNQSIMQLVTWHYVSLKKHSANYVSLSNDDVECPLGVRNGYATN